MKKKIGIIFLCLLLLVGTYPKQKADAFPVPLAIPAGGGAVALGALALGGVIGYIGLTEYAEEISDFGNKVWDKTSAATKSAINSAITWIDNNYAVPHLKIDYSSLSESVYDELIKRSTDVAVQETVQTEMRKFASENTQTITYDIGGVPVPLETAYPNMDIQFWGTASSSIAVRDFDINDPNTPVFMLMNRNGNFYFGDMISKSQSTSRGYIGSENLAIHVDHYGRVHHKTTALNVDDLDSPNSWVRGFSIRTAEQWISGFNEANKPYYTLSITTVGTMTDIITKVLDQKVAEHWESMKDAGLVIDGNAILEANPTITWDGEAGAFIDGTGAVVDTGNLSLPRIGVKDGVIGYPISGTWIDIKTGEGVGEGIGEGEGVGGGDTVGDKNIDWSKLKQIGNIFTTKFPFSLPWDIGRALEAVFGQFDEHNIPSWTVSIYNTTFTITIPEVFHSWFPITRNLILIAFDIGLIYSVRKLLGGAS